MEKKTVLLVDDSSTNNLLFSDVLFENGIQSVMATSGSQALKIMKELEPDLILLDIHMPGMNGIEVLQKMNTDSLKIPVIVMSADDNRKQIKDAKVLGALDFLIKPVDIKQFMKKISKALS